MLIHKTQIKEFSLEKDTDPKTIFRLGVIDPLVAARLIDANMEVKRPEAAEESRTIFHTEEQLYLFALCGIKGWGNLKDAQGNEVPFEVEEKVLFGTKVFCVKPELLAQHLTLNQIVEIGTAAKKISTLGVDEIKN